MQGDLQVALSLLQAALETAVDDVAIRGHVSVLYAQTMWAVQTDEFREKAKAQLFECITTDPENLAAINVLAGMGILTNDDSLVDAALSELSILPLERRRELDPRRDISYLLTRYHFAQNDVQKAASIVQGTVYAEPSRNESRNELACLMLQRGEYRSSLAILSSSIYVNDLPALLTSQNLRAIALARSRNECKADPALSASQRSIMLLPSDIRLWKTLAYVKVQGKYEWGDE